LRYFSRRQQWELPLEGTIAQQKAFVEIILNEHMHQMLYKTRRTIIYTLRLTDLQGYDDDCNRLPPGQPVQPVPVVVKRVRRTTTSRTPTRRTPPRSDLINY